MITYMDTSFASAGLHLRIYPTDMAASMQNDLSVKWFILVLLVTTQELHLSNASH